MYRPPGRQDPAPVEVARVRGGISARVGAVAVASVLGAVIWIGVSGRPGPTVPASERPGVARAPTASPSTTVGETITPVPNGPPSKPPAGASPAPVAFLTADDFSVVTTIGNSQLMTRLVPTEQGHLLATFRVPIPGPAKAGTLEFAQVWSSVSHDAWVTLATWDLPLESLSAEGGRDHVLLDRTIPARRTLRDAPFPVTRGYQITVRAPGGPNVGVLIVDIRLGPNRQLAGNDGIFGWPVVGQIHRETIARGRGLYNQCRWDISPVSGTPRSGDEAGC